MTQCCNKKLYVSDNYCPECGELREILPVLHSAFTLDPTINKTYQGNSQPFTGRIIDTYYYVREGNSLESGYLWLTLRTEQNEEKKFSIQAESDTFQNINVGDVLSVISPTGIALHHSPSRSDRKIVTHDNSPAIIIYHKSDDTNVSYVEPCIAYTAEASPSAVSCWMVAIVSGAIAWVMYYKWMLLPTSPWFIGACVLPVICIMLARRSSRIDSESLAIATQVEAARKKLINIFYSELGYDHYTRPTSQLDHICPACTNPINNTSLFCCYCGTSQEKESKQDKLNKIALDSALNNDSKQIIQANTVQDAAVLTIEKEVGGIASALSAKLNKTPSEEISKAPQTVQEYNEAIFAQYSHNEQHDYMHKHTLSSNRAHQVNTQSRLVRVIDKHMGVNVNQGVHATTQRTEYVNRFGTVVDTKDDTTYREYRDIYLKGFLIIEDKDGNITKFSSNADILKLTNVDDLILIGESTVKRIDTEHHFLEYVYNLNKDKTITRALDALGSYYPSFPIMSIINLVLFPALLLFFAMGVGQSLGNNNAVNIGLLGFVALGMLYYFISPFMFGLANGANKQTLLPALHQIKDECIKNRSAILAKVK